MIANRTHRLVPEERRRGGQPTRDGSSIAALADLPSGRLTTRDVLTLQRAAGNQAVTRLLSRPHHGPVERRPVDRDTARGSSGPVTVQRHALFEHWLLGDVAPNDLAALGAHQDLTAPGSQVTVGGQQIGAQNVTHVLQQEINRLKIWQEHPPTAADAGAVAGLQQYDPNWQVKLVSIPSTSKPHTPPLILTYGELNTLADFYGNVDELKAADPDKRHNVVQSVRRQGFEQLLKIFTEYTTMTEAVAKKSLGVENLEFKGSFNITGVPGEIGQMTEDKKGALDPTTKYTATLARNACHFPPESWHTWAHYHAQAIALAQQAKNLDDQAAIERQREAAAPQGAAPQNPANQAPAPGFFTRLFGRAQQAQAPTKPQSAILTEQAEAKRNEALLANGFGDHYLQDSYASGHLINKTQIMQWFVEWLDAHPDKWTYTADTNWRAMQNMATQPGLSDAGQYTKANIGTRTINNQQVTTARNPQAVENTQGMQGIGWQQRFQMLGLRTPPSVTAGSPALALLLFLQEKSGYLSAWSWKELTAQTGTMNVHSAADLRQAAGDLVNDHVAFVSGGTAADKQWVLGQASAPGLPSDELRIELRKEYIVSTFGGGDFKTAAAQTRAGNMADYDKMMQATVYKDYVRFMRDGFLQRSTNKLHDHYCVEGLDVIAADGHSTMHIYGDMHMLDRTAAQGVMESATTANMSRDSIIGVAMTGHEPQGQTTADILDRLPSSVVVNGNTLTLDQWHNQGTLRTFTEQNIFAHMDTAMDAGAAVLGSSLGKITKDEDIHGKEAF